MKRKSHHVFSLQPGSTASTDGEVEGCPGPWLLGYETRTNQGALCGMERNPDPGSTQSQKTQKFSFLPSSHPYGGPTQHQAASTQ